MLSTGLSLFRFHKRVATTKGTILDQSNPLSFSSVNRIFSLLQVFFAIARHLEMMQTRLSLHPRPCALPFDSLELLKKILPNKIVSDLKTSYPAVTPMNHNNDQNGKISLKVQ